MRTEHEPRHHWLDGTLVQMGVAGLDHDHAHREAQQGEEDLSADLGLARRRRAGGRPRPPPRTVVSSVLTKLGFVVLFLMGGQETGPPLWSLALAEELAH